VDVTATLEAPCPPEALFEWVEDLNRYPQWLDIVPSAVADSDGVGEAAWIVDLWGRLGPFARSKRLRMVRTERTAPHRVVFTRHERDGRTHSPWVLHADVEPTSGGEAARLTMRLHYGGSLWGPVLERLLRDEIERSKPRLLALLSAPSPPSPPSSS
jgi:uncharacterized protein YndB with AHSA1/START domain